MGHWWEIWTRPGDPNFGRVIDDPVSRVGTLHDGVNLLGNGSLAMPSSLPESVFDDILSVDPITLANSKSSLARLFSEADPTTPVFEFIPDQIVPPANKQDPDVNVAGLDIKSVLGYARTQALDWDGTANWSCSQCDWQWGAPNLIINPSFGAGPVTPLEYQLLITATGGTFTITDGTDTTAAIAFNASAATIETRIETDLAAFTDILVTQQSTVFIITYVDPQFSPTLALNVGSLTGGTATLTAIQDGGRSPAPWTVAGALNADLSKSFGYYDAFQVSNLQAHTGSLSLLVNPGTVFANQHRNPGAQQVVSVSPGLHQASVWVYPTSGTDEFRLGIFGVGEEWIAFDPSVSGGTLTPNTWNQLTISNFLIPEDNDRVIFRVQCTNTGPSNPSAFFIDDAELYPGLPADSAGGILEALYNSYVDPALQGTIYWDDGSATNTPYLTLGFTNLVDSAGVAWDRSDIALTVYQRQSFLQVLQVLGNRFNYEFRVVPDDVEAGTWLFQVYNPSGMQTDYTTAQTPAIQGGQGDTQRGLRRFLPSTYYMVEASDRSLGRGTTGLIGALGRIAAERISRELPDQASATAAATEDADDATASGLTYRYVLTLPSDGSTGADTPLDAYQLGDALTIHDPPDVDDEGRFWDVTVTLSADSEEWEVQFLPLAIFESPGSP